MYRFFKINSVILVCVALNLFCAGVFAQSSTQDTEEFTKINSIPIYPIYLSNSSIHEPEDPDPGLYVQCFDDANLRKALQKAEFSVIIHHGKPQPAKSYKIVYSHTEFLPFFVNNAAGIKQLDDVQIRKILNGTYINWKEVGGADMKISIFTNKVPVKAKAMQSQLQKAGTPLLANVVGTGGYDYLANEAQNRNGAFVLGLRSSVSLPEKIGKATMIMPQNELGEYMYQMPVYLYVKTNDKAAFRAAESIVNYVSKSAGEDKLKYPVDKRLKNIFELRKFE